ncbi:MAG TPA: biopolymer transporter ExbD [Gammaproteobacteria bacterium]|nr:biopolymer transporter ExbD [Gammaproteobacteria bacterium]
MRKHHYRLQGKDASELNIMTFLNIMVVLLPFLLATAVFSRITVVELNLPSSTGGSTPTEIGFRPEVIVRKDRLEVTDGSSVIASIPNLEGGYDLETLSKLMLSLKQKYPDVADISVLVEPQIPYDYLIQVMDAVRSTDVPAETAAGGLARIDLFPAIAVGEAP